MSAPDRLKELLNQSKVTGIDFVYVHKDQVTLDIYFLRSPATLDTPLVGDLTQEQIRIYNASGDTPLSPVPLTSLDWVLVNGGNVLRLITKVPGDFTLYNLRIDDPRIDPRFNDVSFSFKAHCESDLDCKQPEHECPSDVPVDFPVDYRARDFWSFRRALLDFASQRYPDWKERLEADVGVMLVEVMSALGDELAYYQDRIAREAYLETATQRRSLRRHARLVDYNVHNGLGASTWLDVTVQDGQSRVIPAGMNIWALADDGTRIDYEVDKRFEEIVAGNTYVVDPKRNSFQPHIFDEDDTCLFVGTKELFIKDHHAANLPLDDLPPDKEPGRWVLLKTSPKDPSIAERTLMVRLITVEDTKDPVFNENITYLVWEKEQALPFEMDLTVLEVRGNLVPVIAGKTEENRFLIGIDPENLPLPEEERRGLQRAVEREGPDQSVAFLFTLADSESKQLVWRGDKPQDARPEIRLVEVEFNYPNWIECKDWEWRRSLLGVFSSERRDRHFILEDGTLKRVVGYQRIGEEVIHVDYASGAGTTIRFGDGEFGLIPTQGTVFQVTYRLGNGRRSNVSAGSINNFDPAFTFIKTVTNPLPVDNGVDQETPEEIRQSAPEAFRGTVYRAVRPEDYAEAAERLSWVQRAGATFRWTGSWLSVFVSPDPRGVANMSESQRSELVNQINRFRQAGREAHVCYPRYADLDLEITVCVKPDAYRGEVKESVLQALLRRPGVSARPGFFSPDNFTFGTPLKRSTLEAIIQGVPGVRAVKGMRIRRRGWFDWQNFTELWCEVGKDEIIRVENDPLRPGRGSIRLIMEGGA